MKDTLTMFTLLLLVSSVLLTDMSKSNSSVNSLNLLKSDSESDKKIKKANRLNLKKAGESQAAPAAASAGSDKFHPEIDGLGTIHKGGKIDVNGEKVNLVIETPPFKVKACNQLLGFNAQYIEDLKDYRKRKDAFFIISVLSVHVFQAKDASKLIHSANFAQIDKLTQPLKGAKGCISIDGGRVNADITICFKNEADTASLLNAIKSFNKCRMGDNLVPISEDRIKKLAAACTPKTEAANAENFEMSLDIRSGNKWDADRSKFFHPKEIIVPGTPEPAPKKK